MLDEDAELAMTEALALVAGIRSLRGRFELNRSQRPDAQVSVRTADKAARLRPLLTMVTELALLKGEPKLVVESEAAAVPAHAVSVKIDAACDAHVFVLSIIDRAALKESLATRKAKAVGELTKLEQTIAKPTYQKVPEDVKYVPVCVVCVALVRILSLIITPRACTPIGKRIPSNLRHFAKT